MKSTIYKLTVKFSEDLLGTQPGRDTPASDFLRDKAKAAGATDIEDETETLPEMMEKGTTGFHVDVDGMPTIYNYHVKGALKESAQWLNGTQDIKGLRSKIEAAVMVFPRRITLVGERGPELERPLRAMTVQGPRTSLARSEVMKAGTSFTCELRVLDIPKVKITETLLRELLDYASMRGMGQWRNSGIYGQFDYTLVRAD